MCLTCPDSGLSGTDEGEPSGIAGDELKRDGTISSSDSDHGYSALSHNHVVNETE